MILNGKEKKEASAICFEIRIPRKETKELVLKIPSKIMEVILIWKKTKTFFGLSIILSIITEKWGHNPLYPFFLDLPPLSKSQILCFIEKFSISVIENKKYFETKVVLNLQFGQFLNCF